MNQRNILQNISKIIERDSKSTTYKFALLRGVIDIIQDNSPYITFLGDRVYIPTGLLVEKWILFYYPIFESSEAIPQIHGSANVAFRSQIETIIDAYRPMGGFSGFYNDLKNKGIPENNRCDFIALAKQVARTITRMPMKHIGWSVHNQHYSIFQYSKGQISRDSNVVGIQFLIQSFGEFSIPREYYEAFKILGSFISGRDSIFVRWAEFSVNASGQRLSVDRVMNEVLKSPITERAIRESKQLYSIILQNEGSVRCVWTGQTIASFDIDHMIPFSVWRNNDLWNLLPSRASINNKKRNKIPAPELIESRKECILHYWDLAYGREPERFRNEIQLSLLGKQSFDGWHRTAMDQLKNSCKYLINSRGYEAFQL